MGGLTRRAFIQRAAAAAGAAGAATAGAGVLQASPAAAVSGYSGAVDGLVHDEGGQVFDIKSAAWGAKGDAAQVSAAGSVSAGSTAFTWSGGSFNAADAGKVITVQGAGASGAVLSTTIASVQSPEDATLTAAAGSTVASADFAYGSDDTAAIVAAVAAAGPTGRLLAPAGIYLILAASNGGSPITLAGAGGLLGDGGRLLPGGGGPATVLLCGDPAAGLLANGGAIYEGFCCDGNNVGDAPLQTGVIADGKAAGAASSAVFIDVWATRSAGSGWGIFGARADSFYSCGSRDNALDGIYIDGGSSELELWHFEESGNGRYGVHADRAYPLGTTYGTSSVRFWSGTFSSGTATGKERGRRADLAPSKVFLRGATDWKFTGTRIAGDDLSGPVVDLDQSAGHALDFSGCWISSRQSGQSPGLACIRVGGSPPSGSAPVVFLKTDRVNFVAGDTSVLIEAAGSYIYSALDWTGDGTANGPAAASGLPGIDTLLEGRTGRWVQAILQAPWSGTPMYRVGSDGLVELSGSVTSAGGGGTIFTLAPGYYDPSGPTLALPAATTTGATTVSVDSGGNVSASDPGGGNSLCLDGIAFPVN